MKFVSSSALGAHGKLLSGEIAAHNQVAAPSQSASEPGQLHVPMSEAAPPQSQVAAGLQIPTLLSDSQGLTTGGSLAVEHRGQVAPPPRQEHPNATSAAAAQVDHGMHPHLVELRAQVAAAQQRMVEVTRTGAQQRLEAAQIRAAGQQPVTDVASQIVMPFTHSMVHHPLPTQQPRPRLPGPATETGAPSASVITGSYLATNAPYPHSVFWLLLTKA